MRRFAMLLVVLAGCGDAGKPTPTPTATAAEATATRSQPSMWTTGSPSHATPLPCPVASGQAAERSVALGSGEMVKTGEADLVVQRGGDTTRTKIPGHAPYIAAFACARDGRFAVAWTDSRRDSALAYVALRSPGGKLGPPVLLAHVDDVGDFVPGVSGMALAFAPDGELLVSWAEPSRVRAVTFSATGRRGGVVTLGKASDVSSVVAEIAGNGRAVVVWTSHDSGLQVDQANRLRAVFREHGGLFGPAQLVHVGKAVDPDDGQPLDLRLAVARDGRALLQWSDITGSYGRGGFKYPVRIAEARAHGRFGRSLRLTRDGRVGAVALGADGTAVAAWRVKDRVRANFHAPGKAFARPETVPGQGLIEATRRLGTRRLVLTFGDGPIGAEVR